ncbi:MAG: MFS transporter [Fimbriimonadaceae bacterium]
MATENRLQNLQTLRAANADGALATAFATLVGGAFLTGFIAMLGGSDYIINLVSAIPALLGILQIPGGIWGRSVHSMKRFVLPGGLLWRVFHLPLIALPFVPLANPVKLTVLVVCVATAAACSQIVNPVYNEWVSGLVPVSSRGFFFSRRNAILTATGASIGLIGATVLDFFKKSGQEELGFSILFGAGSICAAASFIYFVKMHDHVREEPQKVSMRTAVDALKLPLADKRFRAVMIFLALFVFGQALPGNLFSAYAIKELHLPYSIILCAGFMHAMGNVISARFWGFLADKYGNRPVLAITGFGLTVTPAVWLACRPDSDIYNAWVLLPAHLLIGATWAGVALCQYNIMLSTAKDEQRANYMSLALAVQSVVGFAAPMLGAQAFASFVTTAAAAVAYKGVVLLTMVIRFLSIWFLFPVKEEGATEIKQTLRELTTVTPTGLKAFRALSRSGDASLRAEAIASVADAGTSLAGDQIIKALHDPSPRVRREAAQALGRLNDPNATRALLHQLTEHPDLVEEETVEALGHLGSPEAVAPLIKMLGSPRSLTRRAAAKALARIGDARAVPALVESGSQPGDPDLRRASLQALRILGAAEASQAFCDALFDPTPSVRIAAAEGVADLELESALPYVRQSLSYYDDEAASEVAYALGAIGSRDDIPLILKEARQCVSMITRRRCLLGVARVLGVEQPTYRLMLLEGMARDQAIMKMLAPHLKGSKRLRDALELYSQGRELEAIRQLSPNRRYPEFSDFAENPVDELFLVVATLASAS